MSAIRVNRRRFMAAVAGAAVAAGQARGEQTPRKPPNVVFAFSDEHRWQSMPFTETPGLHAPQMARLANEGVTFTSCVSNYPVCSPYRAILMTGRWPYETGMIDNNLPLDSNQVTLGKVFRDAGYKTGYVGKWHLGGVRAEPFGFDHSLIWTGTNNHYKSKYHLRDSKPVDTKGYNATLMTDQALEFISQNRRQPFLLMLSWNPPHSNFLDAPPEKRAMYPEGSLGWRENVPEEIRTGEIKGKAIWDQSKSDHMRGYHAHISAIDDEIGRVLTHLKELGLDDNTIFVYTSDHGTMMGSHGLGSKRQPYEESIRVPLFIRWPEKLKPSKRGGLIGAIDLMPTLCGLAGLDVPAQCHGRNLSAVVTGEAPETDTAQFIMHISKNNASGGQKHPAPIFRGVRTRRYTYAVKEQGPWVLFDNEKDPYQFDNRIDDSDLAGLREQMHVMLQQMLKEARDPFPLTPSPPAA